MTDLPPPPPPDFDYEASGQFTHDVLALVAKYDDRDTLYWRTVDGRIEFFLMCNDEFVWACSDLEQVFPDDLPDLRQAYEDVKAAGGYHGALLWIARKRQMRPQGAMFVYFRTAEEIELFKQAAPEREAAFGNPYTIEGALENYGKREGDPPRQSPLAREQYEVEHTRDLVNALYKRFGGPQ